MSTETGNVPGTIDMRSAAKGISIKGFNKYYGAVIRM